MSMRYTNVLAMSFAVLLASRAPVRAQSINWGDLKQNIDGFGAGQIDSSFAFGTCQFCMYAARAMMDNGLATESARNTIMDLAFSTGAVVVNGVATTGIGLSIWRTSLHHTLQDTPGNWNYQFDPHQSALMKMAYARGAKIIASTPTPPAWMKTNNSIIGGKLKTANYQDYATFLSRYAKEYAAANGVSIYAISLTNEPDNTGSIWETCEWLSPEIAAFLSGELRTTWSSIQWPANQVPTKIITPETTRWEEIDTLLTHTKANALAMGRVDIVAGHVYGQEPGAPGSNAFIDYGKPLWQTEASHTESTTERDPWVLDGALQWAVDIHYGLANGGLSAWMYYDLALWQNGYSLMALNAQDPNTFFTSKGFWVLGNFSRFVRPGFRRMTTQGGPPGLLVSAYRDPKTDQFVVVAVNPQSYGIQTNLSMAGFWTNEVTPYVTSATQNLQAQPVTYLQNAQTIPAKSVVTFVSRTRNFQLWANAPNAKAIAGDFSGDGKADIALAGGDGWNSVPVAISLGNGTFSVKNFGLADFALWANAPGAKVVAGDVNRDGRDDLIVTGGPGWTSIPVAFSNGDGSFYTTNFSNSSLPALSRVAGVKVLAGDVNNDGRDDVIMTGGSGSPWVANTIPVGLASATTPGAFTLSYFTVPANGFSVWAQDPTARASVSDFNGDGRADIVLTGGSNWTTLPVAMANSNGTFTVSNVANASLPAWSRTTGAKMLTGCRRTVALPDHPTWHRCNDSGGVGGDLLGDIVLTGGVGWSSIKVGFGTGNGAFSPVTDNAHATFAGWAQGSSVKALSGDFDGNGRADIALVGGDQWWTVPMAFSFGNGWFSVVNYPID